MSRSLGPYYMPQDKVGVLGLPIGRSQMDMKLQAEFNRLNDKPVLPKVESYVNLSDFGPRTRRDLHMQSEFNSLVREGYTIPKERYSNNSGLAQTSDNPYINNPVRFVSLK